jgi:hypothetical protein
MITMHMCLVSKHSKGMGKEKVVPFSFKLLDFLVKQLGAMANNFHLDLAF